MRLGGRSAKKGPKNALGYLRVMFAVEDVDDTLARLRQHGGPDGILIGLAEQIGRR